MLKASAKSSARNVGGRPAKFKEPSRPVTITLPERVLSLLAAVDPDRAKAITGLVDKVLSDAGKSPFKAVELVRVTEGKGAILVSHSPALAQLPWIRLIEVAPARFMISVKTGTSIESLEVAIEDLIDALPDQQKDELDILQALRSALRASRRSHTMIKQEILLVDLPA